MIHFVVIGTPEPAGSKKSFPNKKTGKMMVVDANPRAKGWQATVAATAYEAMQESKNKMLTGALHVEMVFYTPRPKGHYGTGRNADNVKESSPQFPTVRPDCLKWARAVEDALSGVCYRDDAQIVDEVISKHYGTPARVAVLMYEL